MGVMAGLSTRDRRALIVLAVAFAIAGIYFVVRPSSSGTSEVVAPSGDIPTAEQRLERMRLSVARVPGKSQTLAQARAELAGREKGLFAAPTAAQAQEQVLQIVRKIASQQAPAVEIHGFDLAMPPRKLSDDYGQVSVAVTADCTIDQLMNMLADISARPELIATESLQIVSADPKQKTMHVRLAVSGVVPRRLIPEHQGAF
jgi:Type II secretion system (T2SS), protein M subtype b